MDIQSKDRKENFGINGGGLPVKIKRNMVLSSAVTVLLAMQTMTAFGADGSWTLTDAGYTFTYSDGRRARGTWEDIDGEWYHFDRNGIMETGWKTVGNIRYHFNQDGSLSEGWQYDGPGGGNWYYYDSAGDAKIQWFHDNGKWYWFDADGKMNQEAIRTIKGKAYTFRRDGSMRMNEYAGFSYTDYDGQPDPAGDILAVNTDGTSRIVSEAEENEIAEYINAFPDGWRKKFRDDGWRFVYCPSGGAYRTFRDRRGNVLYSCNYSMDEEKKELLFSKTNAVKNGFGAYVYENSGDEMKKDQFPKAERYRFAEISESTGLPAAAKREYDVTLGALFYVYQDQGAWAKLKEKAPDITWTVERIAANRSAEGRLDLE